MRAQTEMPKRKADLSVDEWLKEGTAASKSSRTAAATNYNQKRIQPSSTVEGQLTGKAVDSNPGTGSTLAAPIYVTPPRYEVAVVEVTPNQSEVATETVCPTMQGIASEEDAAKWFWTLLSQLGYERW